MGEYSIQELTSIFAMQGFAGLSLFSVLLLMALGLAIIFGQMGVINMAHGEFMAVGAYTTYLMSPSLFSTTSCLQSLPPFSLPGSSGISPS